MYTEAQPAASADRPGGRTCLSNLSEAERREVAAMLGDPPPLAPWAAGIKQGDEIRRSGRRFRAEAKIGVRMAFSGSCKACAFPIVSIVDATDTTPKFKHFCPQHQRRSWADTASKPKPRRGRKPQKVVDVRHELKRRKERPGAYSFSPGDFLVRKGHGYLIRRRREVWHERSGRYLQVFDTIGLCSTCGTSYLFTATATQLSGQYQTRRCERHRNGERVGRPWRWTRKAADAAWKAL